ncbi:hypothetical protein [Carboxylicivirga sp. N1Y90]|uniref:hypothetical protein n=1 Tax=Carboxylicivirga fragile TaxID=3417571 RepID=UPI003D332EAF|nr:PD40 domain-containing protein [Marinilabiliaceae bacterium N1Y90]
MKVVVFIFALVLSSQLVQAQKNKPGRKELLSISNNIQLDNYSEAAQQLKDLLLQFPDDPYLSMQYGLCLLNIDYKTDDAIPHLEIAKNYYSLDDRKNDKAIETRFYLAQAYHLNYRFEEALEELMRLKDMIPAKQKSLLKQIEQEIAYNENAIELKKNAVDFRISNLGQAINSEYDEHSPVISADESTIVFTSNRQGTGSYTSGDGLFYEDIHQAIWREGKWIPAMNIGAKINTDGNDATCSLSADGRTLIIYRNDGLSGNLYFSNYTKDGWSTPEKFPKPINTDHAETHGSLSYDGNTLVFASDRPKGFGGSDIYISRKLPNGQWGKVMNAGPTINTVENEESPFLSHDERTLFFASMGHKSMGGYDIFKSKILNEEDKKWSEPQNIGYPINTPADDLFYSPTSDGQRVYFASERAGGFGRSDIYLIEFPETDERTLSVVAGFIFTEEGLPSHESRITLSKADTGEEIGYYRPHPENGKYVLIVPTGVEYKMTIETFNKVTLTKSFKVSGRLDYSSQGNATYLDPIIVENNKMKD